MSRVAQLSVQSLYSSFKRHFWLRFHCAWLNAFSPSRERQIVVCSSKANLSTHPAVL